MSTSLRTGFERTSTQDPSFGLQQLLDVTDKALSPGVNDPTTAVHALSHISAVLCSLTARTTGPITLYDTNDQARVNLTLPSFAELLDLVMDQLTTYALTDPRTAGRSIAMLSEVTITASQAGTLPAHAPTPHGHLARVQSAVEASTLDASIRADLLSQLTDIGQLDGQPRA
ncbi:DUF2254 family protein [Arthrobacter sp. Ld5]|uniref:DUF2254 family protein n=1 Tax=Arthrobacter sp. Ld5 TaxID=649152 RepID=UPI003EBBC503